MTDSERPAADQAGGAVGGPDFGPGVDPDFGPGVDPDSRPGAEPADRLVFGRFQSLVPPAPAPPITAAGPGRRRGRSGPRASISHRAVKRPRQGWATMAGLAGSLIFAATAVGAIVIITATPDRRADPAPAAAVPAPQNPAANAQGCLAYDQALRRLDEIVQSDVIPHPEISGVVATARGRIAAAAEQTWGPTQQAMDRAVSRLQIWSDHERDHADGERLDDSNEIKGVREATAGVAARCAEAGVVLRNRLAE